MDTIKVYIRDENLTVSNRFKFDFSTMSDGPKSSCENDSSRISGTVLLSLPAVRTALVIDLVLWNKNGTFDTQIIRIGCLILYGDTHYNYFDHVLLHAKVQLIRQFFHSTTADGALTELHARRWVFVTW